MDLKENFTVLVSFISIFFEFMKENQKEEEHRACRPAIFYDATGIIKEEFWVCYFRQYSREHCST